MTESKKQLNMEIPMEKKAILIPMEQAMEKVTQMIGLGINEVKSME